MTATKAGIILLASAATLFIGVLVIGAPTTVVLIASGMVTIFLSMLWGVTWDALQDDLLETAKRMFPAILILIFVGMLVGAWILSGTVPLMIFYGLKFLFATAIVCSFMSVMTGTSWGTISTLGVALMGVAVGLGVPLPYAAGAIIVGALFGDKLSPISDTTVLAAALSGADVFDHIKHMLYTTIPGYVISLILFIVLGFRFAGGTIETGSYELILTTLQSEFTLNPLLLLPPFVVLYLIFKKKPILPVFTVGIIFGAIFAILFQGATLGEVANTLNKGFARSTGIEIVDNMLLRGGISSMLGSVAVIIAAATFGAPLKTSGIVNLLINKIKKHATGYKSLMYYSYAFHMGLMLIIGGYYTTFAIAGPILQPMFDEYGLERKNLSRLLEDTGTTFSPLIPWSSNGVFMASTLGVAVSEYALFIPMAYLGIVFAMIYIATGIGIAKTKKVSS